KLIGRGAAINKADTSRYIRREPTPRITCGQSDEAAASKIRLGRETDAFNTDAKVAAPEILYIGTAAPRIVTGKKFVLTDLADIDTLIRVGELRLANPRKRWINVRLEKWSSRDAGRERVFIRHIELASVASESIGAPNTEVPFMSAIEIAHRRCRLHHLFLLSGIFFRAVGVNPRRHYDECEQCAKG